MNVFATEPIDGLEHTLNPLREAGHAVTAGPPVSDPAGGYTEEQLVSLCADVDALMVMAREKVTAPVITEANRLRIICKYGNGVDNIDVNAATAKGIIVANCPVRHMTVAEFAFGQLLAVLRKIPATWAISWTAIGGTQRPPAMNSIKKQWGIVGFGAIGREFCKRLRGWDVKILAHDPALDASFIAAHGAEAVSWDTLFAEADIVSLHLPLLETTRGVVSRKEFAMMKSSAVFINSSRGSVVDEKALIRALENKEIAGGALDVFEREPVAPDNPLRKMPNAVLTPHVAGHTAESFLRIAEQATRNCLQALPGTIPDFVVNKDVIPLWKKRFAQ